MKKILTFMGAMFFAITSISCTSIEKPTADSPESETSRTKTYLEDKVNEFREIEDELCSKSYYELTNDFSNYSTEDLLNSEIFHDELERILKDKELAQKIAKDGLEILDATKNDEIQIYGFSTICKTNKNIYAILPTSELAPKIALWSEEEGFKIFEETFSGGLGMGFFPEVLEGKSLLYVFGGDPTEYSWVFYSLDHENMQAGIIEQCTVSEEIINCELEYKQ